MASNTSSSRTNGHTGSARRRRSSVLYGRELCQSVRELQLTRDRYKILFLDVLFPMDLDKVIFVDAGGYTSTR